MDLRPPQKPLSRALTDLIEGARKWRLWTELAREDLSTTYRRTLLGVAWIGLSFATFVAVKYVIFGSMVAHPDLESFGAYLVLGFFAWQFMAQIIHVGPETFARAESWIRNDPIPLSVFMYQNVFRSMIDLALTGVVLVFGLIYFGVGWHLFSWLAIPALILYTINAMWVVLLLGLFCLRFRDIKQLTSTIMRVMFFMTPIFWLPHQLGDEIMGVLWWNPFAQFIWILRTPVLDQSFVIENWIYVLVVTVLGWSATLVSFALFRRRVAFWF